jgi:hypothetical protein
MGCDWGGEDVKHTKKRGGSCTGDDDTIVPDLTAALDLALVAVLGVVVAQGLVASLGEGGLFGSARRVRNAQVVEQNDP